VEALGGQARLKRRTVGLGSPAAEVLDIEGLLQLPLSRYPAKTKFAQTVAFFLIFRQDGRFSS
jgi:hypothetical protein